MERLCTSVANPFARDSFVPGHFTGSAFILSPDQQSLLLILHGKLNRWLQPGGHVDASDRDVLETARREAREEVGIRDLELLSSVPIDLDIHDIPARKAEPEHAHFDVRYLFRAPSFDFAAASDAKAARWVPLEAVDAELADGSVARVVAKLRARS
jgi:8-oxo-dGTP pyrophosphatase MutT (NUDIX family)